MNLYKSPQYVYSSFESDNSILGGFLGILTLQEPLDFDLMGSEFTQKFFLTIWCSYKEA